MNGLDYVWERQSVDNEIGFLHYLQDDFRININQTCYNVLV